MPTSQQQTDSDVSSRLPLSTAHARSARTPLRDPSSRSTPNEIESTTPTDDRPCDDDSSRSMGVRPLSRSLQERLELAKIPLGQLVRQTRDRLNESKGCDLSESRVSDLDAQQSPPPVRPTTLSCDTSNHPPAAESASNPTSQAKRVAASSLPPSPNRLAPPSFNNPFLTSHSYPNRLATSFNDLSGTGLNDTTAKSSDSKEYEVSFFLQPAGFNLR